jgi:predicted GIY-YIG superfamily endonuclease
MAAVCYLLHFDRPYVSANGKGIAGHYLGSTKNLQRRLAEHAAGRGARLLAVVQAAGIGWELTRLWPGGRARERQLKRQGSRARLCPLCGITPRALPRNRDGSVSRSLTTDAQKLAAGLMTAAQLAEHTALRYGAVTGKPTRPAMRGPARADLWADQPAGTLPTATVAAGAGDPAGRAGPPLPRRRRRSRPSTGTLTAMPRPACGAWHSGP